MRQKSNFFVRKSRANGNLIWSKVYDGPEHGYDQLNDLELDPVGNAYVTGFSRSGACNDDFVTLKLGAADGGRLWTKRYAGLGGAPDWATNPWL